MAFFGLDHYLIANGHRIGCPGFAQLEFAGEAAIEHVAGFGLNPVPASGGFADQTFLQAAGFGFFLQNFPVFCKYR
jgi:hypothetical protein